MKRAAALTLIIALAGAGVFAWLEVRRERVFRRLVATGEAALAADRTYSAIEAFSGALALRGDSMLAFLRRGQAYRRRGELPAALRDLRQAAALDQMAPQPRELLGDVTADMRRYDEAAGHYRAYLNLEDRSPYVLYKLGVARFLAGRPGDAVESARAALVLNDRFAEAYHLLGIGLRALDRPSDAERALRRAIAVNPAFVAARDELAHFYQARGRPRDALEQLEALVALEPSQPERAVALAAAYGAQGRHDAAVVALDRAVERFPDSAVVHAALGRAWLRRAEDPPDVVALAKARRALEAAAARADATSESLALYGHILLLSGNPRLAERVLQAAVARFPIDPAAFRDLAAAARRLGHRSLARDALVKYQALTE